MAHDIEYEVGYRKPPKAFQFQKGCSGNRSGPPRNVPGIPELLWETMGHLRDFARATAPSRNSTRRSTSTAEEDAAAAQGRAGFVHWPIGFHFG
jgi:hypothetical protein